MLNRRSLRIKVMQSLFALQQCKDANYELCIEQISDAFLPDLNSMEVQDKPQLSLQKKNAIKAFEKAFAAGETSIDDEDLRIKKTVNSAFQFYKTQLKKDSDFFRKNLVTDVEKIYDHYVGTLSLMTVFADLAEADKKASHKNFLNNSWVKGLRTSEALKKESLRLGRHWQDKTDKVRQWFKDVFRQDNEYLAYLDRKNPSADDQKKFITHLFK